MSEFDLTPRLSSGKIIAQQTVKINQSHYHFLFVIFFLFLGFTSCLL